MQKKKTTTKFFFWLFTLLLSPGIVHRNSSLISFERFCLICTSVWKNIEGRVRYVLFCE